MGAIADGDELSVVEPAGVGDWLGRGGRDVAGGRDGVGVGLTDLGLEAGLVAGWADWVVPAGVGTGRTRM